MKNVKILAQPSTRRYAFTKFIWGWNYYVIVFEEVNVV
jgi:hypothetical protein